MPAQYPIRAVAKLTGISVDTLRAWERRYRVVEPARSERGRVYSDSDVRRLVLLRAVVESGHHIGQVASLSDVELAKLANTSFPAVKPVNSSHLDTALAPELRPVMYAIERFDYEVANAELGRLALLLGPVGLVHNAVLPLMQLIGEHWETGKMQIAQEHMFSACVRNLLGGLLRQQRPAGSASRLLFTTPANELHEFGILAAAMLAVARQFEAVYLGPNLPSAEILSAAGKCDPHVVVMGITSANATSARAEMSDLARRLPPATEIWLGGTGAHQAVLAAARGRTLIFEDLAQYERHLTNWRAAR